MVLINILLYYKEKLPGARIVLKGSLVRIHQAVTWLLPPTWPSVGPQEPCSERVGPESCCGAQVNPPSLTISPLRFLLILQAPGVSGGEIQTHRQKDWPSSSQAGMTSDCSAFGRKPLSHLLGSLACGHEQIAMFQKLSESCPSDPQSSHRPAAPPFTPRPPPSLPAAS